VAVAGVRQLNPGRTLAGGQPEFLEKLSGKINHVHMLDSTGKLHESDDSASQTTVHTPFGQGEIDFDEVIPKLIEASNGVERWTVDLCYCPDPWSVAAESLAFARDLRDRHSG